MGRVEAVMATYIYEVRSFRSARVVASSEKEALSKIDNDIDVTWGEPESEDGPYFVGIEDGADDRDDEEKI